jgi:hypothetical protein
MVGVALLAVVFAIFHLPFRQLRAAAFFTFVILILLTATLGALLKKGAPWIGFSLFGWGWLVISFVSFTTIPSPFRSDNPMPVPMPVVSMWLVEFHESALGNVVLKSGNSVASIPNSQGGWSLVDYWRVQVCLLWASLLMASIGGMLARWLDGHGTRPDADG